jgi:Winged helix DNA-binding domain
VAAVRRRIGDVERRTRLALGQRLAAAARVAGPADVARQLVALHGTDPASVFLSVRARAARSTVRDTEAALYQERALVRMLGMRRTMFAVPVELAPVIDAACTRAIAARERQRLLLFLAQARAADDPERWLRDVEASTLRALAARGSATAAELGADEPRLRQQVVVAEGKSYAALQSLSTRVLSLLAAEGKIVRGRPRGSWTSSQYEWSLMASWLDGHLPAAWTSAAARVELVRRWLAAFGPGTIRDIRWWTGWTAGEVRRALAQLSTAEQHASPGGAEVGPATSRVVEVELDGTADTGFLLAYDLDPPPPVEPWVALLPALDPTPMGWAGRGWFLGPHGPALFDRSGNIGPSVWVDGRVVGGWAQRPSGEIAVRLLEDVGREAASAVEAAAGDLQTWLGTARVTPRFRTPLERELSA